MHDPPPTTQPVIEDLGHARNEGFTRQAVCKALTRIHVQHARRGSRGWAASLSPIENNQPNPIKPGSPS